MTSTSYRDLQKAINYIVEDISIHREWAAYIKTHPKEVKRFVIQVDSVGNLTHHRRWIRRLSTVLRVLQGKWDANDSR